MATNESPLCGIGASGGEVLARTVLRGVVAAAARKSIVRDEPDPSAKFISASETTEAADDPLRPLVRHPPPSAAGKRTKRFRPKAGARKGCEQANATSSRVGVVRRGRKASAGRRRAAGSRQTRRGASGARSGIPRQSHATRIGYEWRGRAHGSARREG